MNQAEEIKSKLDIVDIIREYINLKPAGVNFKALCPFHHEKTPSFIVSPEKQIWHCFGCGKGGDVISFVMEIEGLNFIEALKILAPKAGVALKERDFKASSKRNRLLDLLETSKNYYHKILMEDRRAQPLRDYLKNRGLNEKAIQDWELGYSPESWDDLLIFLKNKGFNDDEIFSAGMSVKKEGINKYYNRFRDRIMFPIKDVNGAVVAFSGRLRPEKENDEKAGKYINSPQTLIYDKSKILFGLDKAKMAIKTENKAIIVEGQMDVIAASEHGFKNTVASSGTALTKEQIRILKRYTNNILLAFDMDSAGQMAADRGIKEALEEDVNIKIITLAGGKDPDECLRHNPGEWRRAVEKAKSAMEYYFEKIFSGIDLDNLDLKKEATKKYLTILSGLENEVEKSYWLKKLSEKINVSENFLLEALKKTTQPYRQAGDSRNSKKTPLKEKQIKSREESLSEILLALLLKFPNLIEYANSHLLLEHIAGSENKRVYKNLIIYYNNIISENSNKPLKIDYNDFKNWFIKNAGISGQEYGGNPENNNQLKLLDKLVILGDEDYYDTETEEVKKEAIKIILSLKKNYLSARMKELESLIAEFEKEGEEDKVKSLLEELKFLSQEIKDLEEE